MVVLRAFPNKEWQSLGVKMHHFTWVFFVVTLRLFFEFLFKLSLYFGQALEVIFQSTEPLVHTAVYAVVIETAMVDNLVHCEGGYPVPAARITDPFTTVIPHYHLSLYRRQPFVRLCITIIVAAI
jgi:hypothetical protein